MRRLGTRLAMSTTAHPQTDGLSERSNRTMIEFLRSFVNYAQDDWDQLLFAAEFSKNSHLDVSRGAAPFELDLGRAPTVPASFLNAGSPGQQSETVSAFVERIRSATLAARDKIQAAQSDLVAKKLAGRVPSPPFAVDDLVLVEAQHVYDPVSGDRPKLKLSPRWVGPWPVTEVLSPTTFRLLLPVRVRSHDVINIERLRRYTPPSVVTGRVPIQPGPVGQDATGHQLWAFEKILDKKISRRRLFYLVQWSGYQEPSWEPATFLLSQQQAVDQFEAALAPTEKMARVGRRRRRRLTN